jgi:hypothetical protein
MSFSILSCLTVIYILTSSSLLIRWLRSQRLLCILLSIPTFTKFRCPAILDPETEDGYPGIYGIVSTWDGYLGQPFLTLFSIKLWISVVIVLLVISRVSNLEPQIHGSRCNALQRRRQSWPRLIYVELLSISTKPYRAHFKAQLRERINYSPRRATLLSQTQEKHENDCTIAVQTSFGELQVWVLQFRGLLPYIWPSDSPRLQLCLLARLVLVLLQRGVNIMLPHLVARFTQGLSELDREDGSNTSMALHLLLTFVIFMFLATFFEDIEGLLWIPVTQNSRLNLSRDAETHCFCLDSEFHRKNSTGEIVSTVGKSRAPDKLAASVFVLVPTLLDLLFTICDISTRFGRLYTSMVALHSIGYIMITIVITTQLARLGKIHDKARSDKVALR